MKKHNIIGFILGVLLMVACTDLDVTPYSELSNDNFYQNKVQIMTAINRTYTQTWISIGMDGYHRVSELSADQMTWPNKGRHGYDGGVHGRQHYHSWTIVDDACWQPWNRMYTGIGHINNVLGEFPKIDFAGAGISENEKAALEAELRGYRAFYYMKLLDLYGNIPIATTVGTPVDPPTVPRQEVFAFVESELLEAAKNASPLSQTQNGKFTLAAVYATLADLYLNAEVWTGTPRWDDCITYCNKLINGEGGALNGTMKLDNDIDIAFSNTNKISSTEIILSNASNKSLGRWVNPVNVGYYGERDIVGSDYGANNGMVVTPNAYEAYNNQDLRKHSWFFYGIGKGFGKYNNQGPYLNISSDPQRRENFDYVVGSEEFANLPVIFCNKPIKAVIDVQGGNVVITEWYSPEFPSDEAKLLIQEAFNGKGTKDLIVREFNENNKREWYLAGGANISDARQYPWSTMNDFRYMWYDCKENTGARFYKYKTGPVSDANYANADLVLYRLTDIYFFKAEALMRKNGGSATQEAVDLINMVKQRAFLPEYWNTHAAIENKDRYNTTTLTLDELLAERGREFIFEAKRRMDLIRFGKFEFALEGWWDANAGYPDGSGGSIIKDPTRRLLAIPDRAMKANRNLVQNPGYE